MPTQSAFLVRKDAIKADPAIQAGGRGARKLLVTELYAARECAPTMVAWSPPMDAGKCPVQEMADTEVAVFNQFAKQDRHKHENGTEMYMVLEGTMTIEVDGIDYLLSSGDMIVVNPNACHEVKPCQSEFLCRVVTVNCGGPKDKYSC